MPIGTGRSPVPGSTLSWKRIVKQRSNRWPRPQVNCAIFCEALDCASPQDQVVYLNAACRGKPELRAQVELLLRANAQADGFLDRPSEHQTSNWIATPLSEGVGSMIGPYKLLEVLGEGGFGLVYLAEQHHPVRRKVAVKILKPGMDSREVITCFEAERQALALMDHPNIAKVLDAGTISRGSEVPGSSKHIAEEQNEDHTLHPSDTDSGRQAPSLGRPYFVMELVRGISITDYCDQHLLAVRERLELFITVCNAVQHVHQRGIIHRDIKPSNVMVTPVDSGCVAKVIDFGIAKAMGQQLTDKTIYTGIAQMIGTPLYMSPEQAAMRGEDLDTRTDIYSLGVMLYELLTGTTPFR